MRKFFSRFRDESGQSAVEFALVLPLLLLVLFAVVEFSRAYNAYNDLNQMAADGARLAAVGRYPGQTQLVSDEADTNVARAATVTMSYSGGTCSIGSSVTVSTSAPITFANILGIPQMTLRDKATMRVERCPS